MHTVAADACPAKSAPADTTVLPPGDPSTTDWDAAFATWKAAHHAAYVASPTDCDVDEDLCEAESAAWERVMFMPAPHNKALAWKLEYLFGNSHPGDFCEQWRGDIVAAVVRDARLLAQGVS